MLAPDRWGVSVPEAHVLAATADEPLLADRYHATRQLTEALAAPLSEADATIQSMDDASPAKWHLAHTTWFFETFLLRDHATGYRRFDERWPFLFNSYYEAEGARMQRPRRGMLSRPTVAEIGRWRAHVDAAMEGLLHMPEHQSLIELGIAHEQQHQELLLTDIKHALFQNPLAPAMWAASSQSVCRNFPPRWRSSPATRTPPASSKPKASSLRASQSTSAGEKSCMSQLSLVPLKT